MRHSAWYLLTLLLLVSACGDVSLREMKSALRTQLVAAGDSALTAYYDGRDLNPRWTQRDHLNDAADTLLASLCRADAYAMNPERYALARLDSLYQQAYTDQDATPDSTRALALAKMETTLTHAFVAYVRDLHTGSTRPPEALAQRWTRADSMAALQVPTLAALKKALAPPQQDYAAWAQALTRYRALQETGGWPTISQLLQPGATGNDVEALRARLAATGDLEEQGAGLYDQRVADAVGRFQQRHGLPATGLVDAPTLQALNVSAEVRVRQLAVNLERRRWLPVEMADAYLIANTADEHLYGFRDNEAVLRAAMETRATCPLPAFAADSVTAVVISAGRLRLTFAAGAARTVEAGPPASGGGACVEVGSPVALGVFVLDGSGGLGSGEVQVALNAPSPRTVALSEPMPFYTLPLSAWVDAEGAVHFRAETPADRSLARALRPSGPRRLAQACERLTAPR